KPVASALKRLRLSREDFELVKVIGRGAFGEVQWRMAKVATVPSAPSNAGDRAALKALERENALLAQTIAELRSGGQPLDAGSDAATRMRELEMMVAALSGEKEELLKDRNDNTEKLRLQERKLREETLRSSRVEAAGPPGSAAADVARLQAEVDALELQYKESLAQQQARYNSEMAALRDQLHENDALRNVLNREIADIIRWVADEKEARGYLQALATKMTEELEYLKIGELYFVVETERPQMRDTAAAVCEGLSRPGPALHSREDTAQVGGAESDPGRAAAQPAARELGSSRCEMSRTLPSCCTAEIQAKQQVGEELSRTRAELLHSQRELLETRQRLDALAHDMKRKEQHIREMQTRLDAPHQPSNSFLDRPASQLSYLDQFLSEAPTERHYDNVPLVNNEEKKLHQFLVRTFSSPTKCNHCTSLMIGLTRQGVVCETCGLAVHTSCCARVASRCPLPASRSRRPLGIDPARGQGTAYEGYVKITRTAARRCRIAELRAPGAVHSVQLARGRLLLGYRGGPGAPGEPSEPVPVPLWRAAAVRGGGAQQRGHAAPNARPLDASGWLCCVCGGATNGFPFGSDTTPFIIYLRPLLARINWKRTGRSTCLASTHASVELLHNTLHISPNNASSKEATAITLKN
ncbi:hypothetical protein MSG28_015760, partial [Choristoneura fumiferana]